MNISLLSQMESIIDWFRQNVSSFPPIEDQNCSHTSLNGTNSTAEWEWPTESVRKWLGNNVHIIAKVVLTLAYVVIIMISLFGNYLVCQVFLKHNEIKKSTGLLILNLAISDILIILLNSPFAMTRLLAEQWVFGRVVCHVSSFAEYCSLHVSTLTLMAVAIDRHRVILYPMKARLTYHQSLLLVAVIWSIAIFLALPHGIYQNLFIFMNEDGVAMTYCLPNFPEPSQLVSKYVDLGTFILLYILPLMVIVVTYSHLGKRLWIQNAIGDESARQMMAHYQKRKKSIRMLILIVLVFAVCWFPLNFYVVLISNAGIEKNNVLFYAFHWLAMSSTCYNPFIYCWLNRSFRAKLRSVTSFRVQSLFLCKGSKVQKIKAPESHELRELKTSSLLRVPLAVPEAPVFEDPSLATGDNSQGSVQGDWEDPDPSLEEEVAAAAAGAAGPSTQDAYFCIHVQTSSH
ncbi:probable G-protein coupled receptor 83 [Arvicola amphibius]|uniref:probable G-protein coupled receptor 83 n=1 Tax=Arvicola amphibius TaxID=1047088 RepID=UPI0018E3521D|nr:probable G-protein coupled receptor 83 [Arvicola amphibius]